MLRQTLATVGFAVALAALPAAAFAQQMSDADYIAKVSAAAPAAVVKGATIVQMGKGGTMRTLQTGTNGFTCLMAGTDAMCADKNAMAWIHAMIAHASPPNVVGFAYMLAGDQGGSNTDPMASAKTADNHWVVTGPHLMMFAPSATTMGYPTTADADPSAPYVMWANTRYAHVMIPVSAAP